MQVCVATMQNTDSFWLGKLRHIGRRYRIICCGMSSRSINEGEKKRQAYAARRYDGSLCSRGAINEHIGHTVWLLD